MSLKKIMYSAVSFKPVNMLITGTAKVVQPVFPEKIVDIFMKIPVNRVIKVDTGATKFKINGGGTDMIAKEIFWIGIDAYESDTIDLFIKLLKEVDTFFDIGANTGLFTLIAAGVNNNISIHSFEPVPMGFDMLEKNKKINNFNNVHINKLALSDSKGEATFIMQENPLPYIPLGSSFRDDVIEGGKKININVLTDTLDNYVAENNITSIDLIKIDTEATEHIVFKGGLSSLNKFKPIIVSEVLDGLNEHHMQEVLDPLNYKYFHITDEGIIPKDNIKGDHTNPFKNYLFLPAEKLDLIKKLNLKIK